MLPPPIWNDGFSILQLTFATLWDLRDQNSLVGIEDSAINGIFDWSMENPSFQIGGGNIWYREGASGGETYLGSTAPLSGSQVDSNIVALLYQVDSMILDVEYQLDGSTAGTYESRLTQSVTVSNTTGSALDVHLYQEWKYLFDDRTSNTLEVVSGNSLQYQEGLMVGETVCSVDPTHFIATTDNLIPELGDANPTTFGDVSGPVGPGVLSAGFQWDFTLAVGETRTFNVEHHVFMIPEPSTWALMLTASLLFGINPLRRKLRRH